MSSYRGVGYLYDNKNVNSIHPVLNVKRVHADAKIPSSAEEQSIGLDLSSVDNVIIKPGERTLIDTGIQVELTPTNLNGLFYYLRVAPRSGLAVKNGIDVGAGVVDASYRGNIKVVLFNFGSESFVVKTGDRIVQLIIEMAVIPTVNEVKELGISLRGSNGFGSSGVN